MPPVGAPLKRPDAPRLLTGRGRYVDDITLPRMVHVAFVRSPHAHAAITRIDVSAAAKSPGVVGVLTGVEAARLCRPYRGILRHYHGMKTGAMTPLALERVRCVGEPVVAIAAETAAAAHDAAARVRVDYAPLPAVLDPDSVTAPLIHPELGDNIIYETSMRGGEPDAAFAAAPRVWRGRFTTGRHTGVPMEPRGLVAAVCPYSAYPRSSVVEGGQVLRMLPGPYRVRHYAGTLRVVAQNKVITSQYRAVGHPIAAAVTESMLDLIARDVALDPAEVRRRNLVRPAELPYTSATGNVYDSGSYQAALARLLEAAKYDDLRAQQAAARAEGRHLGIGLSCFIELTGPGAQFYGVGGAPISGQDGATLRLEPSGAVTALVGVTDQGQGSPTAFAQIVADELGISPDSVAVRSGDTALMPYGGGTWASRGMPIGGSATLLAARALAERIRGVAATLLEAHPDDIRLSDGRVAVSGAPDRGMTLGDLARTVHFRSNELKGLEPNLEATVHFTNAQPWTFTNGAHLAVVEVDTETGRVSVLRYVAVDDCGRVVNPALVEGQTAGGVAQGLGGALMEHCAYDGAGQPLSGTLMDYAVPTAADVPPLELHHLATPAPSIAGGYKGAGEAGTTGAPAAILNAVNDALAPFGVMITDQPITAERVVRAVREGGRRRGR